VGVCLPHTCRAPSPLRLSCSNTLNRPLFVGRTFRIFREFPLEGKLSLPSQCKRGTNKTADEVKLLILFEGPKNHGWSRPADRVVILLSHRRKMGG